MPISWPLPFKGLLSRSMRYSLSCFFFSVSVTTYLLVNSCAFACTQVYEWVIMSVQGLSFVRVFFFFWAKICLAGGTLLSFSGSEIETPGFWCHCLLSQVAAVLFFYWDRIPRATIPLPSPSRASGWDRESAVQAGASMQEVCTDGLRSRRCERSNRGGRLQGGES